MADEGSAEPVPAGDLAPVDDEIDLTDRSAAAASPLTAECTPDGVYTRVSWFSRDVLGLEQSRMIGRSIFDFVHPLDVATLELALDEGRNTYTHVTAVYRHRTGTGGYLWLESVIIARRKEGRDVKALFLSSRDVTARMRLERDLHQVQEVLRLAIRYAPEGLGVTGPDGRWTMVNPVLARLTGWSEEELSGMSLSDLVHPDDRAAHDRRVADALWEEGTILDLDERLVTRHGEPLWVRVVVGVARDPEGDAHRLVVQVSDVARFKERELDLERQALLDPLTGVGNRRLLLDRLDLALADRREPGGQVGLVILDLDDFKAVNDRYGHAVGDGILTAVAQRLAQAVRGRDTVARLGGDEFVVVCPGLGDGAEAALLGARLRGIFDRPVRFQHHSVEVAGSVGMVIARAGESAMSLLNRADVAMYGAKGEKPEAAAR